MAKSGIAVKTEGGVAVQAEGKDPPSTGTAVVKAPSSDPAVSAEVNRLVKLVRALPASSRAASGGSKRVWQIVSLPLRVWATDPATGAVIRPFYMLALELYPSGSVSACGRVRERPAEHPPPLELLRFALASMAEPAGDNGPRVRPDVVTFLDEATTALATPPLAAAGMEAPPTSVYTVRQPKGWWGCDRPYWVACKGVYRSIKRLDAVAVMDVNCLANADYLPVVFAHLRLEFRYIRFVCAERDADRLAAAQAKYRSVDAKMSFITFDPFAADAAYPPRLDVVLAIGAFAGQSLIRSMRLFRALHTSGAARYVVFDNFPSLDNGPSVGAGGGRVAGGGGVNKGRINVYKGPFMFPPAKYMYENATEVYGTEHSQILALAVDIPTYKMHHGHRGINHPVKNLVTGKCEITSQNHGFGVSPDAIKANSDVVEITHRNLNDDTIEGIRVIGKNAFSVQYHPEASPGPHDARYLFDQFIGMIGVAEMA